MKYITEQPEIGHGSVLTYILGFILSLTCTLIPYLFVTKHYHSGWVLMLTVVGFALIQLLVQLVFFLHLGKESKPHWNLVIFLFAAMVVLIVVFGSVWIMNHLNYNTQQGATLDQSIIKDEGVQPSGY